MKKIISWCCFLIAVAFLVPGVGAEDSVSQALKDGKFYADIRVRYENVDQAGLARQANAFTQRTRAGYQSGEFEGFSFLVEGEYITYIAEDRYNDTVNRKTAYPVVADPENFQVNQAFVNFTGLPETVVKAGRQVIALDNHRFIGHVGWRQNNQIFDAVALENKSLDETTLKYGYIYNVNRIFGEQSAAGDWGSKSHFINITNTATPLGILKAFGYWLDFGSDSLANSNQTLGMSLSKNWKIDDAFTLDVYAEYAYQEDYGDNPTGYDADYYHVAPGINWKGVRFTAGYEVLASDNGVASFRTPLATLHKFNGWADKFLVTPAAGLEDLYVEASYKTSRFQPERDLLNNILFKLQYHDFSAEDNSMDYGKEFGLFVKKSFSKRVSASVKYADYHAEQFATNTQKVIVDMEFAF